MKRLALAVLFASSICGPVLAETLPPGLRSATLLPGWVTQDGNRMVALDLQLEPGWKTYWRKPGDSGIPPEFDWSASTNVGAVTPHWPAPEVIVSGDDRTLGFHDRLVLPIEIQPEAKREPVAVSLTVSFGLCETICVPANLSLEASSPLPERDPLIDAALAAEPVISSERPTCGIAAIDDGMRVHARVPSRGGPQAVAIELADAPDVWVSGADIDDSGTAVADLVGPSREPFEVDESALVFTAIDDGRATEYRGCDRAD
ncbi:hypothetical protein MLD63_01000 (plasmid) [Paracoccus sp. TK19116]|uniref:Thiol:disulfide interchange protein DsbD N-terminal domain-containing protein n=1 Tax=Paracoccus albicereus TaxID=2922394 RepID=A0ABT1ML35_9RHOB|nr:protein-disulfide reductase DsbD domain-containing protein [Paracoccus albicereus]MCQ0969012.1 hypothetical protein [Paracoccus albicereus]